MREQKDFWRIHNSPKIKADLALSIALPLYVRAKLIDSDPVHDELTKSKETSSENCTCRPFNQIIAASYKACTFPKNIEKRKEELVYVLSKRDKVKHYEKKFISSNTIARAFKMISISRISRSSRIKIYLKSIDHHSHN